MSVVSTMNRLLCPFVLAGVTGGEAPPRHLRFPNCDTPPKMLLFFFLAAACVAVVVYFYYREPDYVPRRRKGYLAALRSAALLVILFVLSGAFLETYHAESYHGTVPLLFDVSRSMGLVDRRASDADVHAAARILGLPPDALTAADRKKINATSRMEMVKHACANKRVGLLPALRSKLGGRYKIEAFAFGERATVTPLALSSRRARGGPLSGIGLPEDQATQLGGPLRDVVRRLKGKHVAGVVVFTDGAWNRGEDPFIAAQDLGVPVYPVGVGLAATKDVEISFIFAEGVVFKDDTFPIHVRVRQRGYYGESARLVIRRDEDIVKEETIELGRWEEQTHTVEITPTEEGVFSYSAEIEPFEDEMSTDNNRKGKSGIRVIDKKIQVLVVEDAPRWEFRFLKSVLEADRRRIEPTFVLRQADEELLRGSLRSGRGRFALEFPADLEGLRRFNLVVLGNIESTFFTNEELENIEKYVREEGGALLVIAGRNHMPSSYEGTPLEDLLPVVFRPEVSFSADDELSFTIVEGFRPSLTPEGERSPVFRFAPEPEENSDLWDRTEELHWFFPAERLKPAARAFLVHPTESTSHGPVPLVAEQRYGKGRVIYFGIDETWRWRYQPGPEFHRKLWGGAVTTLSMAHLLGETNRVQIETDRSEYSVGDRVKIVASVLDENYDHLVASKVTAVVERGELDKVQIDLAADRARKGVFQGEMEPAAEGSYRVTIAGQEDEAEHYFTVATPRIEFDDPGLRQELLKKIAAASGGKSALLENSAALADLLAAKAREREPKPRPGEIPLWNSWWVVVLATIFLGLEWFLRKRSDLL